jgi:hypothetical protein
VLERELGRGGMATVYAASGGRFYFTLGDRQSDLWMTSVGAGR